MLFVEKKLKKALDIKDITERQTAVMDLAKDLGCSKASTFVDNVTFLEEVVVDRIRDAARSQRESRVSWISLASAFASLISALAAWCAVWQMNVNR